MKPINRRSFVVTAIASALAAVTLAGSAFALDPGPNGWYATGSGIRTKYFIKAKVYTAYHEMKSIPAAAPNNSDDAVWALKDQVVNMDVDKRIKLVLMRDVDVGKIRDAFNEGYDNSGYKDAADKMANRAKLLGALTTDLKEKDVVTFAYDSTTDTTTLTAPNGQSASVAGNQELMKATWRMWFGRKAEQTDLGTQMLKNLIPQ